MEGQEERPERAGWCYRPGMAEDTPRGGARQRRRAVAGLWCGGPHQFDDYCEAGSKPRTAFAANREGTIHQLNSRIRLCRFYKTKRLKEL